MIRAVVNKLFPFIPKLIDKWVGRYIEKKIATFTGSKDKQIDALKDVLVKEVQDKHFWKDEVNRVKLEERKATSERLQFVAKQATSYVFDEIQKDYFLVPKKKPDESVGSALASGTNWLYNLIELSEHNKDKIEKAKDDTPNSK
jgi:hypothetical protein